VLQLPQQPELHGISVSQESGEKRRFFSKATKKLAKLIKGIGGSSSSTAGGGGGAGSSRPASSVGDTALRTTDSKG
jgi:hypothetical protein